MSKIAYLINFFSCLVLPLSLFCMEDERPSKKQKTEQQKGVRKLAHEYSDVQEDKQDLKYTPKNQDQNKNKLSKDEIDDLNVNRSFYISDNDKKSSLFTLASMAVRYGSFAQHPDQIIESVNQLSIDETKLPEVCRAAIRTSGYSYIPALTLYKEVYLQDLAETFNISHNDWILSESQDCFGNYLFFIDEHSYNKRILFLDADKPYVEYSLPEYIDSIPFKYVKFNDNGDILIYPNEITQNFNKIYFGNPKKNKPFVEIDMTAHVFDTCCLALHQHLPYIYGFSGNKVFIASVHDKGVSKAEFEIPNEGFENIHPIAAQSDTIFISGDISKGVVYQVKFTIDENTKEIKSASFVKFDLDLAKENNYYFMNFPISGTKLLRIDEKNIVVEDMEKGDLDPLSIHDLHYTIDPKILEIFLSYFRALKSELPIFNPVTSEIECIKGNKIRGNDPDEEDRYGLPKAIVNDIDPENVNIAVMAPGNKNPYAYFTIVFGKEGVTTRTSTIEERINQNSKLVFVQPGKPRQVVYTFVNETVEELIKTKRGTLMVIADDNATGRKKLMFFKFQDIHAHEMVSAELEFIEKLLQKNNLKYAEKMIDRLLESKCIKKVNPSVEKCLHEIKRHVENNNYFAALFVYNAFKAQIIIPQVNGIDTYPDDQFATTSTVSENKSSQVERSNMQEDDTSLLNVDNECSSQEFNMDYLDNQPVMQEPTFYDPFDLDEVEKKFLGK